MKIGVSRVAVIGQGYVGLPLAMAAIGAGFEVIGIDSQELKVKLIASGISPMSRRFPLPYSLSLPMNSSDFARYLQ